MASAAAGATALVALSTAAPASAAQQPGPGSDEVAVCIPQEQLGELDALGIAIKLAQGDNVHLCDDTQEGDESGSNVVPDTRSVR